MAVSLQHWRQRNALTQVNAAALLGVSQPYLSLLEKGARPLTATVQSRMKNIRRTDRPASDDRFRRQLSALGYPKFAHVAPARPIFSPDSLLLSVLTGPNVDARWLRLCLGWSADMPINWTWIGWFGRRIYRTGWDSCLKRPEPRRRSLWPRFANWSARASSKKRRFAGTQCPLQLANGCG